MSSKKDTTYYMELQPGDAVQEGDQWLDEHGQWQSYVFLSGLNGAVGYGVRARRPIPATGQVTYEEVPGSRTTQEAVYQPQRERIAYEELRPGDVIQEGDEWQTDAGRWKPFASLNGSQVQVRHSQKARRPYKISTIQEIGDALANAQRAATQLQDERDELQTALRECRAAHQVTMTQGLAACKERDEAQQAMTRMKAELANQAEVLAEVRADEKRLCDDLNRLRGEYLKVLVERDEARAEVARLSTELWARKPLEDRVASLTEELAQAREASQQLLQTITDNADQFAWANKTLEQQRDEARAELQRLQEVVSNLYSEPTAKQVQQMLRTWATELDWSGCCFDSTGRDKVSAVQRVLVAVVERIEGLINPEGGIDGE